MYKIKSLLLTFLVVFNISVLAQSPDEETSAQYLEDLKKSRIARVKSKLLQVKREILNKKKKIKKEKNSQIKLKYYEELDQLENEYLKHELSFIGVTTEVNLEEAFQKDEYKKPNLFDEVIEIIKPALDSVKRVSQRPRKIESLRSGIEENEGKLDYAKLAQDRLKKELKSTRSKASRTVIRSSIKRVGKLVDELQLKLDDDKIKLHKLLSEDKTLIVVVRQLFLKFLRTKGKNILFSIIVFLLVLWPLRRWRVRMLNVIRKVITKYNFDTETNSDWMMRPVSVMYSTCSFILASFFGLLCLYLLNDWLLVTLIVLGFSLVIWSLKDKIPLFIEQFKLYMNFGPVREKERVVWKGIPWRVRKLGLYCSLENPFLDGAVIRVHSSEMLKCQSRTATRTEPWFPTRNGDWVDLSDQTYGQVVSQTPEFVMVKLLGGAIKTIDTVAFLSLSPVNLSKGFLISVEFGLDYEEQRNVTGNIINVIKNHFLTIYESDFNGSNPKFRNLIVEFDNAGSSSLNVRVNIDVNGQFASQKLHIFREVNKELVNVCNSNNFVIPFNQLTVHMAKES